MRSLSEVPTEALKKRTFTSHSAVAQLASARKACPKGQLFLAPELALTRPWTDTGESTMAFQNTAVCRKCHDLMNLHSIQEVGGPGDKDYFVFVFECECGRFAAEELSKCGDREAA